MKNFAIMIGIVFLVLTGGVAQAGDIATRDTNFKPGSEPTGFRGIEWGTDISMLKGMKHVFTLRSPPIKMYERSSDELTIGGAKITNIGYGFWNNKLCQVHVVTRYMPNIVKLIDAAFEKFGEAYEETDGVVDYLRWYGPNTRITLKYHRYSEDCQLSLFSRKADKEIENWNAQKAKEGVKTGF